MTEEVDIIWSFLAEPSETRTLEFKRMGSRNDTVLRTMQSIVAMANTDGGFIVLGIDDPEKSSLKGLDRVFGIEENLELFDELGKEIRKISPPIPNLWPPFIFPVETKHNRVAVIRVPKIGDALRSHENHVYVRLEKGNKLLSPAEIVHFAYVKGFERADIELVENVSFKLLETEQYLDWKSQRKITDIKIEDALEKTGLARQGEGGKLKPTRAAVLLFASHPNDLMETKCAIRVLKYAGKTEQIKETLNLVGLPKTIEGPALKQINDAHEYVLNLLRNGIRVPSGFTTTYEIPERAVKEAITNSVIHRDYYTKRDVEIKVFEDRIEIESPGLLPFNITPSNIGFARAQGYRNDLLVKHLREFSNPPNLDQNEGVKVMRQLMRTANKYPPVFYTYPLIQDGVKVVLRNEKAPSEWEKISHFFSEHKYLTNQEARKSLDISDTSKTSRLLNSWVKKGLLTKITPRSGSKKDTRYRLPTEDEKNLFAKVKNK